MVKRGQDRVVLWPRYFDARLSRAQGRRVPAALAVKEPDAAWVASAARKAGLDVEVEEGARHPAKAYRTSGRVLVKKEGSKEQVLHTVAKRMAGAGGGKA